MPIQIMEELLQKVEIYASGILRALPEGMTYHNWQHTVNVVEATQKIGQMEGLSDEDLNLVLIAGWFHDTGFRSKYLGHEEESRLIADEFLQRMQLDALSRSKISEAILATARDAEPHSEMSAVLRDADLYHLASREYYSIAQRLRDEWSTQQNQHFTEIEWNENSIEFLRRIKFSTKYGVEMLAPAAQRIRSEIKAKVRTLRRALNAGLREELGVSPEELKKMKKKLQKVSGRPERGIETMFRLTSKNHLTLSGMADTKANIMISVNAIIISVLIGALMQKLDSNPHLIVPTAILLLVNLLSMIFAILATRPNVTSGKFTREDIEKHKSNLLFFGNFHQMSRNDYQWGMSRLMEEGDYLYSALIDDIYFLGVVLGKKYRYLRIAYTIFMYGIVIAVSSFIIANVFFD